MTEVEYVYLDIFLGLFQERDGGIFVFGDEQDKIDFLFLLRAS